jgi:hypothetical protein
MAVKSMTIEQKGKNWAGEQYLAIQSVEFFSSSGEFTSGVFRSLFGNHRKEIRQFVCVTARDFDLSEVPLISPRMDVVTFGGDREWIEVDFLDHQLFVNSYRLRRHSDSLIRSWSLRGSNDRDVGVDEWTTIDSRHESYQSEIDILATFDCIGGPFRYFRLVNDGPRWDGATRLNFYHLELFGFLFAIQVE